MLLKRLKVSIGVFLLLLAGASVQAQTPVDWTPVLQGFENGCKTTGQFENAFWKSAIAFNTQNRTFELHTVDIEEPYAASLGTPEITTDREYAEYFFPINGTYRGLPIKGLSFMLNYQSGYVYELVFAVPLVDVQAKLASVPFERTAKGDHVFDSKRGTLLCHGD